MLKIGMKCSALLVASGLLAAQSAWAGAPLAVTSTFDSGLEGWEAVGFDVTGAIGLPPTFNITPVVNMNPPRSDDDMVHEAAGGNTGGYARLTDALSDPGSFASAPAAYLGDLSAYVNGTLSFDHRLFDTGTPNSGIQPYSAIFISGDPNDLNGLVWTSPAPAGATGWEHFDITLNEANLTPIQDIDVSLFGFTSPIPGFNTPADFGFTGDMTFDQIMADVTQLVIAFELVDNDGTQFEEHAGIDNVTLQVVPEPGSLALLRRCR